MVEGREVRVYVSAWSGRRAVGMFGWGGLGGVRGEVVVKLMREKSRLEFVAVVRTEVVIGSRW